MEVQNMEDFVLEDYRHPWETGNHWELKRNFIERYKDTYPVDRLLCLAQAYSNIELLNCSYPVEVMKEIHELSKPLKVITSQSNNTSTPVSQNKATASNQDFGRRTKILKICSSSDVSEADHYDTTIGNKQTSEQYLEVVDPCTKQAHVDSAVQNEVDMQHALEDSSKIISPYSSKDILDAYGIKCRNFKGPVSKHVSDQKKYILLSSNDPNENPLQSLKRLAASSNACSITKEDVEKLFKFIKNLEKHVALYPPKAIAKAAKQSKISPHISYNITVNEHTTVISKIFLCELFFKNILISSGTGRSKLKSRESTAATAVKKLFNLKNFIIKEYNQSTSSLSSATENSNSFAIPPKFEINKNLLDSTIERQFVVMDNSDMVSIARRSAGALLMYSASSSQNPISYEHSEHPLNDGSLKMAHKFDVILNGNIIGTGISSFEKAAKKLAASNALENLKKIVYTIKVKDVHTEDTVIHRHELMAWTGGEIGQPSGIVEPITADKANAYCLGLRLNADCEITILRKIYAVMEDYKNSNSFNDLIFATDFSKGERLEMHKMAKQLQLSSSHCGLDGLQQLIIQNKFTSLQLLDYLVKIGGSTSKYDLLDLSKE